MDISTIFDLIEDAYFEQWQEQIKKEDKLGHAESILNGRNILHENFTEEQLKIINAYAAKVENYYDYKFYKMSEKILKTGIKIGINVQKIISEE